MQLKETQTHQMKIHIGAPGIFLHIFHMLTLAAVNKIKILISRSVLSIIAMSMIAAMYFDTWTSLCMDRHLLAMRLNHFHPALLNV